MYKYGTVVEQGGKKVWCQWILEETNKKLINLKETSAASKVDWLLWRILVENFKKKHVWTDNMDVHGV